jgi:hypothetical protein
MEAIARRRIVIAHYNGGAMRLAPHVMFERRGELFVSALNLSKNWRSLDEMRLGHFKLAGLSGAELTEDSFEPLTDYEPAVPQDEDALVLAL